jgi:AmmeMemoRadiSam system protein B
MQDPQDPKARPGRIIVPGADEPPDEAPRIVLPPGAVAETSGDQPEYPKLRPLVLMPLHDGKREVLLVTDPAGVMPAQPVLGIESLPLLQMLDGTLSLNDIVTAVTRESKDIRVANMVRDFVGQLDELLMLESPRFEAAYRELREAYHQLEIRPAAFEGHSYPADREALAKLLDEHFAAAEQMREQAGDPPAAPPARPRTLMAPHLDPRRAGPTIARAYLELGPEPPEPLRVVIFGTGHSLLDDRFALTRKHFETPLGKVACDVRFVDAVAQRLGEAAFRAELVHRDEHSIEFQAIYLAHRFAKRPFKIVPILCGGFHALLDQGKTPRDDPAFESLIAAVREVEREQGGATVHVAAIDLSHVGARFGDPPLDERTRKETEEWDRQALEAARRGDADGWFAAIAAHDDQTRICGLAPTYAMLRATEPGEGRLLHYEPSEEQGGSLVSIAAMVWP